ncbi:MAG: sugar dehydrogenase complex small subunit [Burkholderiales bacterium]
MNDSCTVPQSQPGVQRRRVLIAGVLAASCRATPTSAASTASSSAEYSAFRDLSLYLTAATRLDDAHVQRLYRALVAEDPGFPVAAQELWGWIQHKQVAASALQDILDREQPPFVALPRAIASAWFLGVVGDGDKARVFALEHALNAAIVADVLKPPTYCYGGYASWSRPPV